MRVDREYSKLFPVFTPYAYPVSKPESHARNPRLTPARHPLKIAHTTESRPRPGGVFHPPR